VLIARAAGTTFGEFLRDRIFAPLGMKDTGSTCRTQSLIGSPPAMPAITRTQELTVFDDPATGKFSTHPVF